ncbi:protoporphyrinogen oxidase [Salinigranum rubrum]|uniref:Protoporphyrinogen oxidase n=1 Tax=Salinigranum rubrum TaxID=755307 RepID=A0A2I8VLB7_9EURY|nr:flavodoxin domain-containing protein [Salinigranum rubrum]AUV82727.1 protoporphyrinogen oxidase [Salinigranum rubrum]
MARVALVYGTTEGQTATVAERVAAALTDRGHDPVLVHAKHLPPDFSLDEYDGCVVGASVHYRRHQRYVARFVRDHLTTLNEVPSAFFSVSMTAATGTPEADATARGLLEAFLADTGWTPDATAVFAGALKYSEYGLLTRFLMKRIARKYGGETDTSRDHEYTEWDAVERFSGEVADLLDGDGD